MAGDLLGASRGHDAGGDVFVESLQVIVPDLWMGTYQIKQEGGVGLLIAHDK